MASGLVLITGKIFQYHEKIHHFDEIRASKSCLAERRIRGKMEGAKTNWLDFEEYFLYWNFSWICTLKKKLFFNRGIWQKDSREHFASVKVNWMFTFMIIFSEKGIIHKRKKMSIQALYATHSDVTYLVCEDKVARLNFQWGNDYFFLEMWNLFFVFSLQVPWSWTVVLCDESTKIICWLQRPKWT